MSTPIYAPYGTWKSPISSEIVSQITSLHSLKAFVRTPSFRGIRGSALEALGTARRRIDVDVMNLKDGDGPHCNVPQPHVDQFCLGRLITDPITSAVYHLESRPSEKGRTCIVATSESNADVLPAQYDARSQVHEYGGAAVTAYGGTVYFSNLEDSRVYALNPRTQIATPITGDSKKHHRFAAVTPHPKQPHLLVAILEDHTPPNDTPSTILNSLCLISTAKAGSSDANDGIVNKNIISGADFYSQPRFSPDGTKLAWLQWQHPDMPWTAAEIWLGDIVVSGDELEVTNRKRIAGSGTKDGTKIGDICAANPTWGDTSDTLFFTTDQTNFHNFYSYDDGSGTTRRILDRDIPEDFAEPLHSLSWTSYVVLQNKYIIAVAVKEGRNVLYLIDLTSSPAKLVSLDCAFVKMINVRVLSSFGLEFVFTAGSLNEQPSIVHGTLSLPPNPHVTYKTLKSTASSFHLPKEYFSLPKPISLPIPSEGNELLHVVYYPPTNPEYTGPEDERPPCVVSAHGGPTYIATQSLDWKIQFFTSRGWAWLDVNYRGSSGYGRTYMCALAGKWGIADCEDAFFAASTLSTPPFSLFDSKRCFMRGGSAGGFTALAVLSTLPDPHHLFFAGATSLYGISDLVKLGEHTHKFESRYMDWLLGIEGQDRERQLEVVGRTRSPIWSAERIEKDLLILQGSLDRVVPPEQAQLIVKKIEERGRTVEFVMYEGEGHGFRMEKHIKDALDRELAFYRRVCGMSSS